MPKRPNVLLIVMDAARYDYLSLYGYGRPTTPRLEELAADGVVCDHAFASAPWTPPSHASLFTGAYPSRHSVDIGENLALPARIPVMAEILGLHGYRTFAVLPDVHLSSRRGFERGFQEYVELWRQPYLQWNAAWMANLAWNMCFGRDRRARYTTSVLHRWLRAHARDDEPFFMFVNFKTPHAPYQRLPRAFRRRFEPSTAPAVRRRAEAYTTNGGYPYMAGRMAMSEETWALVRAWYAAAIAYTDVQIGALLDGLRETGTYDDTLVIVTADHGENFGEHGLAYHLFCLYDTLLHVPLVLSCPARMPGGRRLSRLVSLVDVLPTVADLAGITNGLGPMDGRSLVPFEDAPGTGEVYGEFGRPQYMLHRLARQFPGHDFSRFDRGLQCVRTSTHKLIEGSDGSQELYDLVGDPGERRNLAAEQPSLVAALHGRLAQWRAGMQGGGSESEPVATSEDDAGVVKALQDLGYF
jgi:arylsulfatase A-like enzyme